MEGQSLEDCEPAAPAPVVESERLVTLDFIRGVALLGILFANVTAYGQPYTAYAWPRALAGGMTAGDQAIWLIQFVLVDGKFRGLFTLLFGAGIYLFHERSRARGEGRGRQLRRLAILLAFGLAHYFLLFRGDILTLYAVWGIAALATLGWRADTQLAAGLILSVAGGLLLAALFGSMLANPASLPPEMTDAGGLDAAAAELRLFSTASYGEIVADTWTTQRAGLVRELAFVGVAETAGLILLGMAFYRLGLFSGGIAPGRLRRWGWLGVGLGVSSSLALGLWPLAAGFPRALTAMVSGGLGALPHFVTVLGLVALLAAWTPRAAAGWLGRRVVAAGRMAFSNYLGLSVVMLFVFHGWALGLFGQLDRIGLLPVVLGGWVLMLAWSPAWLTRFRYGPLEWAWRCLTYGRMFAMRR